MGSVIFFDLQRVHFYGISALWGGTDGLNKNQIWLMRLIIMQMSNVGHRCACCHKGLPQYCVLCPVSLVGNPTDDLFWTCACSD